MNIAHQFSLILAGIPFVSSRSKLKAIASLNDFSSKDMGKTRGLPMKPGSIIALYSPHWPALYENEQRKTRGHE